MDYKQASIYAKSIVSAYAETLAHKDTYLFKRTYFIFSSVVFDEIEMFYNDKTRSSLLNNSEFHIHLMVSDIFYNFIKPMYNSLFNQPKGVDYVQKEKKELPKKTKTVRFDLIKMEK